MLVSKGFLGLDGVRRNTEDDRLRVGEGAGQSREVDSLLGAARRVGARIEKQHQFLAGIVAKRDRAAAIARHAESRRL